MSGRRLRACVEAWPDCWTGGYDPRCCRFPKSCSCTCWDPQYVIEADLEPLADQPDAQVALRPGAAPEVNFTCCADPDLALRQDGDDPTVYEIACEHCHKDICFLINRYTREGT